MFSCINMLWLMAGCMLSLINIKIFLNLNFHKIQISLQEPLKFFFFIFLDNVMLLILIHEEIL